MSREVARRELLEDLATLGNALAKLQAEIDLKKNGKKAPKKRKQILWSLTYKKSVTKDGNDGFEIESAQTRKALEQAFDKVSDYLSESNSCHEISAEILENSTIFQLTVQVEEWGDLSQSALEDEVKRSLPGFDRVACKE